MVIFHSYISLPEGNNPMVNDDTRNMVYLHQPYHTAITNHIL